MNLAATGNPKGDPMAAKTAVPAARPERANPTVHEMVRRSRGSLPVRAGIWAAITVTGIWLPYVLAVYPLQLAVQGATLGVLGLSVGWLRRQTGMLSFGHAMFFGTSGYTVGILVNEMAVGTAAALLLGVLVATALAFLVGLLIMRAAGVAFSMLTLAIGMLIWVAVTQNRSLTNGFDGLPISFEGRFLGRETFEYGDPVVAWPTVWAVLMLAVAGLWLVSRSVFGRHLAALRENQERAHFTGRSCYLPKVVAFTITGLVGGLAGSVSALNVGYVSPESLFWAMSGQALIVAVIGGVGSVWGPPAGALAFTFLQAQLSDSPYYQLVIGVVLMTVVVLAPGGGADLVARALRTTTRTRTSRGASHA
jgi:branched-chain amino acid transport system permease protein